MTRNFERQVKIKQLLRGRYAELKEHGIYQKYFYYTTLMSLSFRTVFTEENMNVPLYGEDRDVQSFPEKLTKCPSHHSPKVSNNLSSFSTTKHYALCKNM